MGHLEHRQAAPPRVPAAVLTVSDSRTPETDRSGRRIRTLLARAGHPVRRYQVLPDDPGKIRRTLGDWARDGELKAIILTGGTGISPRDGTCEVVESLLERRLEGFGELFRMLSYRQVGAAAYLSRAVAGIYRGKAVFSLPGSEKAVRLAMERLILPVLGHLVHEMSRPASRRGPTRRRR